MAKNKVSVSFSKNNLDIYSLLKSKHNGSSYVCDLIRRDIELSTEDYDFESKIEQKLKQLLEDNSLVGNNSN